MVTVSTWPLRLSERAAAGQILRQLIDGIVMYPVTVNGEETSTDLAANAIVGFDMSLTDSAKGGLRYRYFWADTGSKGIDDATAHAFMATAVFNF